MPETPNHAYNVPNQGELNWHEPLNENFEAYDTDIELRDEAASRGDYEPKAGAKFLATDTGVVSVGDGSDWLPTFQTGRYEPPGDPDNAGSVVFGHRLNDIDPDARGSIISGGGSSGVPNKVSGDYGTIGGGNGNVVTSSGNISTISGGHANSTRGEFSTVGGGMFNVASGNCATVPGGRENYAGGYCSFAAGRGAGAEHDGTFVWSDNQFEGVTPFDSTGENQFIVRAGGGVGIGTNAPDEALHVKPEDSHQAVVLESGSGTDGWALGTGMNSGNFNFYNADDVSGGWDIMARIHDGTGEYEVASDARLKADIEPLEGVLDDVCSLAPRSYRFERAGGGSPRSYGFLAQEVQEVFPELVREDEADDFLGLAYDGFAALAVQAVREQQAQVESQAEALDELEAENEQLRDDLAAKDDRIDELEARLDRLEERTAGMVEA